MSQNPNAWEDDWSVVADKDPVPAQDTVESPAPEPKKASTKVTKAQRRAQQQEFNKQLWAEAEGPKEPNYFLESRNIVPLRSDFKPPPVLLSRKPPVVASRKPATDGTADASVRYESSGDEEDGNKKQTLAEQQAQQAKEREVKQRRYEERRQELFGASVPANAKGALGNASPKTLTPPQSRSATPTNRAGNRGGKRGGSTTAQPQAKSSRDMFEPSYSPKPGSTYIQRRETGAPLSNTDIQPIRTPKGPDESGRGGFGFAPRGG